MFGRDKIAMIVAEFIGTFSLASVVLAMTLRTNFPYFAATAAGATIGLMLLVIGERTGAHLNPAVTLGQWTLRRIDTARAIVFIAAQMLGGVVAWRVSEYLLNQELNNIANTAFDARIFVAEAVGAAVFGFGVIAALSKRFDGLQQAVTIGGAFALGAILASFGGNGLINPAVAAGVRSWSFVYVAAPILGAIVGMNLYALLFAPAKASKRK